MRQVSDHLTQMNAHPAPSVQMGLLDVIARGTHKKFRWKILKISTGETPYYRFEIAGTFDYAQSAHYEKCKVKKFDKEFDAQLGAISCIDEMVDK